MKTENKDLLECPVCWGGGKIEFDDYGNEKDCHYCNGTGLIKPKPITMAIDKQTAGILYSYGYKLQDSEGSIYEIDAVGIYGITLYNGDYHDTVGFEQIGTTYKILARPLEMLTKEIEGKVPLIECAKIAFPERQLEWKMVRGRCKAKEFDDLCTYDFSYKDGVRSFQMVGLNTLTSRYQLECFQYLYSLNFHIGFPENTTTDLI